MPPFKEVPRLPVPPEVADSFRKLRSAQMGRNLSGYGRSSQFAPRDADAAAKTTSKLEQATTDAAKHFGGDADEMMTHFKRWTRWGGRAMGVADFVLPEDSVNKAMSDAHDVMRSKPIRKATTGPNAPSEGS